MSFSTQNSILNEYVLFFHELLASASASASQPSGSSLLPAFEDGKASSVVCGAQCWYILSNGKFFYSFNSVWHFPIDLPVITQCPFVWLHPKSLGQPDVTLTRGSPVLVASTVKLKRFMSRQLCAKPLCAWRSTYPQRI